jgi:glycosyltransferase involved in cell wall biosynthesis
MSMFCSTIIPTINRPTLSRAVCSLLDQRFDRAGFEVIVVNDSGQPLPDMDWQHSGQVQVLNTNRRERSVARNAGAAVARGKFLHFLDDDDWLLPGALDEFWTLSKSRDAVWLYAGYRVVDNDGNVIREVQTELSGNIFAQLITGEGIPHVTSLFSSDAFFRAGMFTPYHTEEVRDLGRRIAIQGDVIGSTKIAGCIRIGQVGSTTDWSRLAETDRWGREIALREPGAFARLRRSANTNYWRGRVCRAYIASAMWNLRRRSFLISTSRTVMGIYFAVPSLVSSGFWKGLATKIQ